MILSEWHRLYNNSLQLGVLFDRLATVLGGAYWMPDNSTPDVTGILQQRSCERVDYIASGFHGALHICF